MEGINEAKNLMYIQRNIKMDQRGKWENDGEKNTDKLSVFGFICTNTDITSISSVYRASMGALKLL